MEFIDTEPHSVIDRLLWIQLVFYVYARKRAKSNYPVSTCTRETQHYIWIWYEARVCWHLLARLIVWRCSRGTVYSVFRVHSRRFGLSALRRARILIRLCMCELVCVYVELISPTLHSNFFSSLWPILSISIPVLKERSIIFNEGQKCDIALCDAAA